MDSQNMRCDDFLLERNLKKSEKALMNNIIGIESLGEVQNSISQYYSLTEEPNHEVDHGYVDLGFPSNPANFASQDGSSRLPMHQQYHDSGLDSSESVHESPYHSIRTSPNSSVCLDESHYSSVRMDDSGHGQDEEDLAANFRRYIKSREFEKKNVRKDFDLSRNRPVLEQVLNLSDECEIKIENLVLSSSFESLGSYDVILQKIKQCYDLISLLANERGSIDAFLMKLPENLKKINFWQTIKKSPRVDALIFDVVQIGKAEQLRSARVVQSMENYCKNKKDTVMKSEIIDELLESLLKLDQLRLLHAQALKALHSQSVDNDASDEVTAALVDLKEALESVASHIWILKCKMIPDSSFETKKIFKVAGSSEIKKDKENIKPN